MIFDKALFIAVPAMVLAGAVLLYPVVSLIATGQLPDVRYAYAGLAVAIFWFWFWRWIFGM